MANYDTIPEGTRAAVDQIVDEFYYNGKDAASAMFTEYMEGSTMKRWEAIVLGEIIRARLASLGYLEIANK